MADNRGRKKEEKFNFSRKEKNNGSSRRKRYSISIQEWAEDNRNERLDYRLFGYLEIPRGRELAVRAKREPSRQTGRAPRSGDRSSTRHHMVYAPLCTKHAFLRHRSAPRYEARPDLNRNVSTTALILLRTRGIKKEKSKKKEPTHTAWTIRRGKKKKEKEKGMRCCGGETGR